ncbi:hypothetical protein SEA_GOCRAZY_74 [Arthrobacter phage GoCrazy]|uniref:Uncharacterized protein n=1 Tax=Arthrobacter phage Kardesai TaxID=2859474 RepID=A0AAE7VHM6_9CAUD|nr:hypothetical protein PQB81_gp077 [Arthrobacter phage Kardesai]QXO12984.1 hypothetical protein SEA_KARDESAI_77 [Arthrobacter phage Kardesai]QXO13572.1 hypothetical protein SEA_GOCRAZY_74 [Arthrobacter phage GoCrazy]UYL87339.1 hypothetical protein SEA_BENITOANTONIO_76 [Arthrobacter phage BenitoAntonio]
MNTIGKKPKQPKGFYRTDAPFPDSTHTQTAEEFLLSQLKKE